MTTGASSTTAVMIAAITQARRVALRWASASFSVAFNRRKFGLHGSEDSPRAFRSASVLLDILLLIAFV